MRRPDGTCPLTQQQLVETYFLEVRARLLDVAAFLDRMDRSVDHNAVNDFRMVALRRALESLNSRTPGRAHAIQMIFSDPTSEPLEQLDRKSAFGAFNTTLHSPDGEAVAPQGALVNEYGDRRNGSAK